MERKPYNDSWAFYLCPELDCGFHFHHRYGRHLPFVKGEVFVVSLEKKVKIELVGMGEDGYQKLVKFGHKDYIFPVNLFDFPHQIDPKVSQSTSSDLHERWLRLIAAVKKETFVSTRKEYVRLVKNTIVQHKLCTDEEFVRTLEKEKKFSEKPHREKSEWRLATQEEKLFDAR